ncbi:MAG TPA: tetraacyldisaccharide 4'-kinase [Desulfuromonas sp.]|nr:tetraacyldisaccharide 4'-kinase [Desulfuromonas sp.]
MPPLPPTGRHCGKTTGSPSRCRSGSPAAPTPARKKRCCGSIASSSPPGARCSSSWCRAIPSVSLPWPRCSLPSNFPSSAAANFPRQPRCWRRGASFSATPSAKCSTSTLPPMSSSSAAVSSRPAGTISSKPPWSIARSSSDRTCRTFARSPPGSAAPPPGSRSPTKRNCWRLSRSSSLLRKRPRPWASAASPFSRRMPEPPPPPWRLSVPSTRPGPSMSERWFRHFAEVGPGNLPERLLWLLLWPLGMLYGGAGRLRLWAYRLGLLTVYRAGVPVVSVGNLTVGGTGKTPTVDVVVRLLLQHGVKVAVVSRGYGSRVRRGVAVVSDGSGAAPTLAPRECGDEPFLLARRNPTAVVLVAPRRRAGVALAVARFAAEVVVLDDGFQHLAVARDLDIVLLDATHPFGNGALLPAGLLREFPDALQRGQLFILTRCPPGDASLPYPLPGPLLRSRHELARQFLGFDGSRMAAADLVGRRGVAFAGIAAPEHFFAGLRGLGLDLSATLSFPDHADYDRAALAEIARVAAGADFFVTTEKDGVKLRATQLPLPCYQAPLELLLEPAAALEEQLLPLLRKDGYV